MDPGFGFLTVAVRDVHRMQACSCTVSTSELCTTTALFQLCSCGY